MSDDQRERRVGELLRDLRSRVEPFEHYHPDLVGTGIVLDLTMFDEHRKSGTAGFVVGQGPSKIEQTRLALAKLRQAIDELNTLQGPQPAINAMKEQIERFIAKYESG